MNISAASCQNRLNRACWKTLKYSCWFTTKNEIFN